MLNIFGRNQNMSLDSRTNSPIKNKQIISMTDQINYNQNQSTNSKNISQIQSRKKQYLAMFVIHVIISAVISFQNIFIIYGVGLNYDTGITLIAIDLVLVTIFCFVNSLLLVPFKTLVLMYTLLDTIFVAEVAALIGLVGSILIGNQGEQSTWMLITMVPISFFFFVGNFRVCIRFADWSRSQILIYKFSILIGAVCFFEIGAYFMASSFSYSKGQNAQLDGKVKDFITLYAFGTFQFFLQLFAKISDFDQTSQLKWVYKFKKEEQTQSKSLNRQIIDQSEEI